MASEDDRNDYPLDNAAEAKRLSDQHAVIKAFMGNKLVVAPIDLSQPNLRILDSGTADGTWLLDLRGSLQSPESASMVGIDINAPRFPTYPPTGVSFQIQNVLDPWPKAWRNSFDLVHQRLVLAGSGSKASNVVKRLLENVKPGGWVQLTESAPNIGADDGPAMHQFFALLQEMFAFMGTGTTFSMEISQWVEDAGFVNVESKVFPYDIGAKIVDETLRARSLSSVNAAVAGLTMWGSQLPNGLKCMTRDELATLPARLNQELSEQGASYPLVVVWGQKPE
ncbi:S-adenosyl-L-methionine-dependent methyltransferase [Hypoxylon sp. FL1857]|nr:S-adenosyl-L-methionine-dependent methyltransferase [Hypoxylon sp. FL1857]